MGKGVRQGVIHTTIIQPVRGQGFNLLTHLGHFHSTKPTVAKALPFHQINLDKCALDERIRKDLVDYIHCRVETSHRIQDNITPVVPHLANKFLPEPSPQDRFVLYLTETSGGSFLFAKLILDLIERYRLSSFKWRGKKLKTYS